MMRVAPRMNAMGAPRKSMLQKGKDLSMAPSSAARPFQGRSELTPGPDITLLVTRLLLTLVTELCVRFVRPSLGKNKLAKRVGTSEEESNERSGTFKVSTPLQTAQHE